MDKKQLEILTNIIGAVESGGQVYGQRRYEAYAGKRENSENEKTCTLVWAQNYGNEARKLCQMILKEDPGAFRGADTAGIESRLSQDWEAIGWNPSATEKAALIAIITTPSGKKCQDELFEQLMETYIKQAVAYGVNTVPAQMMWCEIEHLGGLKPTKRIFGRAAKPYTPDSIYASLILDQQDTSNNNQVGDEMYQPRHQCCVKWIKQYVGEEKESAGMTENELRQMVANNMRGWIGLKRSDRSHMVIINLYNSCLPLARGYRVTATDDYCATGASAAGIKAGLTDIIPRECSCGYMIQLFQKMGRWVENDAYIPDTGDFVFYYWKDGTNYATTDCTGWPNHVGIVLEVNKNTREILIGECNMGGGLVGTRKITINGRYIRGYGVPDYASKATGKGNSSNSGTNSGMTSSGSASGGINKTPKWVGEITQDNVPVKTWAGSSTSIKSWPVLGAGNLVDICDTIKDNSGHDWYYILIAKKVYGFVDSSYIRQAGSNSGNSSSEALTYKVGTVYTLQVELKVRTGAGTGCPTKSYSQLTLDGRRHDKDHDGCLDAGTQVTCQAIKNVGSDIWILVPSGWIAAYYDGNVYVK